MKNSKKLGFIILGGILLLVAIIALSSGGHADPIVGKWNATIVTIEDDRTILDEDEDFTLTAKKSGNVTLLSNSFGINLNLFWRYDESGSKQFYEQSGDRARFYDLVYGDSPTKGLPVFRCCILPDNDNLFIQTSDEFDGGALSTYFERTK